MSLASLGPARLPGSSPSLSHLGLPAEVAELRRALPTGRDEAKGGLGGEGRLSFPSCRKIERLLSTSRPSWAMAGRCAPRGGRGHDAEWHRYSATLCRRPRGRAQAAGPRRAAESVAPRKGLPRRGAPDQAFPRRGLVQAGGNRSPGRGWAMGSGRRESSGRFHRVVLNLEVRMPGQPGVRVWVQFQAAASVPPQQIACPACCPGAPAVPSLRPAPSSFMSFQAGEESESKALLLTVLLGDV